MDPSEAVRLLQAFRGTGLTEKLAHLERSLKGQTLDSARKTLLASGVTNEVLQAAGLVKRAAAEISVVIHALGILLCLPHILEPDERIEYLSLGAGNTGRPFDLETDQRIAEFKFSQWRGGPEAIRQNVLFKDFYLLAEYETPKKRYLYVVDPTHPLKFLQAKRALRSILSRDVKLRDEFRDRYGDQHQTVGDYYRTRCELVTIEDVSSYIPDLLRDRLTGPVSRSTTRQERLVQLLEQILAPPVRIRRTKAGSIRFIAGDPVEVVVEIRANEVRVHLATIEWHGQTPRLVPNLFARLSKSACPRKLEEATLINLIQMAREVRLASFQRCKYCKERNPPEWMFDKRECQSCAQQHGVVF